MATTAPSATDDHPYHLPQHLPTEPIVGTYAVLVEHGRTRDALVQTVFPEHGMPALTLVLIKPGNRGIQYKVLVPHKSKATNGCYWCLPSEVTK